MHLKKDISVQKRKISFFRHILEYKIKNIGFEPLSVKIKLDPYSKHFLNVESLRIFDGIDFWSIFLLICPKFLVKKIKKCNFCIYGKLSQCDFGTFFQSIIESLICLQIYHYIYFSDPDCSIDLISVKKMTFHTHTCHLKKKW